MVILFVQRYTWCAKMHYTRRAYIDMDLWMKPCAIACFTHTSYTHHYLLPSLQFPLCIYASHVHSVKRKLTIYIYVYNGDKHVCIHCDVWKWMNHTYTHIMCTFSRSHILWFLSHTHTHTFTCAVLYVICVYKIELKYNLSRVHKVMMRLFARRAYINMVNRARDFPNCTLCENCEWFVRVYAWEKYIYFLFSQ